MRFGARPRAASIRSYSSGRRLWRWRISGVTAGMAGKYKMPVRIPYRSVDRWSPSARGVSVTSARGMPSRRSPTASATPCAARQRWAENARDRGRPSPGRPAGGARAPAARRAGDADRGRPPRRATGGGAGASRLPAGTGAGGPTAAAARRTPSSCRERRARQLHRPRHPGLLRPDRARARDHPPPGEGVLLAGRFDQRHRHRADPAARRRLPEDRALRGLPVRVRAAPGGHPRRALGRGVGRLLHRGGLPLLLVPPHEPRGERLLGRARRPPPERGVQPRGGAPAGRVPGLVLVGLLPAAGLARASRP